MSILIIIVVLGILDCNEIVRDKVIGWHTIDHLSYILAAMPQKPWVSSTVQVLHYEPDETNNPVHDSTFLLWLQIK